MADAAQTHVLESVNVKRPNAVLQGMARHPNICVFVLALVFTIIANYGHSFNSKPVVSPPKQPQFLFPPQISFVLDSSRGSLEPLVKRLQKDEIVFVMFYAPWCSKSLAARAEFEKAATMLHDKVTFAAVNCWWPEGECSKRYKFLVYPAFLAYHTNLDGYRYTGVLRADHFVKFVENLIYPLSLVHTYPDIIEKISRYDSLVLGFFNLMRNIHQGSYRQFYFASMRIQEKDPQEPVHFAVTSNVSLTSQFHLSEQDIILIKAKGVSIAYPFRNNITCSNIVNWILKNKGRPIVSRLISTGLKSQSLARKINGEAAVIVFHRENPFFSVEQGLRVFKDVALQYQSCLLNKNFKNLNLRWRGVALDDDQKFSRISRICHVLRKSHYFLKKSFPCCFSAVSNKLKNHWYVCEVCQTGAQQLCSSFHAIQDSLPQNVLSLSNCSTFTPSYQHTQRFNVCCHNGSSHSSSDDVRWMSERENLENSFKSLFSDLSHEGGFYQDLNKRRLTDRYHLDNLEHLPRQLCDRYSYSKLNSPVYPQLDDESVYAIDPNLARELKGIGCTTNQTLNFFSMDSQAHWMFTDRLGIEKQMTVLSPSVVIFDTNAEQHYIMKENFTVSNTMSFILNFLRGNLKRQQNFDAFNTSGCGIGSQACVQELDSKTFLSSVRTENKDVVVLIYAHWCGFCQSLSHTFLTLAQYFAPSKHINFMRINGAVNDLPWKYTIDSFPQILFFPAHRKANSIVFPSNKDKSLINLIQFVLRHSTYDTRLHLASDVCSKPCIERNFKRSKVLLQKLNWTYRKMFININNIAHLLSDGSTSNSYLKLSYEFLRKRMNKVSERIKNVRQLIKYLDSNIGGSIDKDKIMALFQVNPKN